jgi:outer membrane receptor protein involved in Fe transport
MNQPLLAATTAAARIGLASVLCLGALAAQDTNKTDDKNQKKDEAVALEKFEVTGSRIKRLDVETPAPVATYSVADIEAKGYTNVGDFVQSLPFNSSASNSIYQTASFLRGAATTNLRGLGSQRFLTLVNDRRAVPYALTNSGNRSVFDFNSLPAAAIDSVELLKDGASAIYGSDAITGVLNIKLKKNFSGLSVGAYYGNTLKNSGGDTGTKELSVVAGVESGKTRIFTAFDAKMANSNFLQDYGVHNTDFSFLGSNKGLNNNSTSNYPANLTLTRAQATALGLAFPATATTATSWSFVVKGGAPTNNPTLSSFTAAPQDPNNPNAVLIGNENRYNFAPVTAIYPAYDYISNYTSFEHTFNDSIKAFGDLSYSKNSTYYAFTPVVIGYSTEGLTLPATNPYNPFGLNLTSLSARALFGPVRKFDTESSASNALLGLKGTVANRWDWESAVSYGSSVVTTVSRNAIRASVYQAALNGTTRQTAINPFGPSDNATLVNSLFTSSTGSNKGDSLTYDAHVSGKLLDLPAGELGVAAGVEARNDRLTTNPDTAAYIGSGGGSPLSGKRSVTSEYVELTAPIYRSREFGSAETQLAGRHEHYSDFGNATKPKVGLKIRLPDTKYLNVILRGSYSESFQAPALGLLYSSQTIAFTSNLVQDPLRPQDPPVQQRIVTGGNPHLLPETAKVQYVGTVIESPKVKNLSVSWDFFDMRINQVIVTPSSTFLLSTQGRAQFPNAIVRDNTLSNPGPILRIESVPSNNPLAYQLYRGFDYGVKYSLRNTRFGEFTFGGDATQIIKTGSDSGLGGGFFNNVGRYYNPRWKATATTAWNYKDYGATLSADWTGRWFNDGYTAAGWGENPYTLIGAQLRYNGFRNFRVTVGSSNILNNQPPPNGRASSAGYDQGIYGAGALGRFLYVRVRRDF